LGDEIMAQCKECGRKGLFSFVDKNGLCAACAWKYQFDFDQRIRIISDCQKIIADSKSLKTKLHRIDVLLEHTKIISQYEAKGMNFMTPSAKELFSNYSQNKIDLIKNSIREEINKIRTKADLLLSPKSKISETNKILLKIAEWKNEYPDKKISEILISEEKTTTQSIHNMQLQLFIDEADKAFFMKQSTKALNKLQEALYFIKTDMIPDESQRDIISNIEKKIIDIRSSNDGKVKES